MTQVYLYELAAFGSEGAAWIAGSRAPAARGNIQGPSHAPCLLCHAACTAQAWARCHQEAIITSSHPSPHAPPCTGQQRTARSPEEVPWLRPISS